MINPKHMRIYFFGYLLFLLLVALLPLNGTSVTTMNNLFVVHIRLDYLLHAALFIPWAFIYILIFRPSGWSQKLWVVATGLLMAFATEGIQYFLTYRAYNINDLLANFLGVFLGSILLIIPIFPKSPST